LDEQEVPGGEFWVNLENIQPGLKVPSLVEKYLH
jgi:hypothetical protein